MNRALLLTLFFVGCGPARVEPEATSPMVEQTPVVTTMVDPLTGFPCEVREVLQRTCASCHAGAQYVTRFTSRDDLLQPGRSSTTQLGAEVALRVRPGATSPMPPSGVAQQPTLAERQLIDGWIQSGMPPGACGPLTTR